MPPGTHRIVPFVEGEPKPFEIEVNAKLAELFGRQVDAMKARADAGEGDLPFLDFNHDGGRASARVHSLYWGGSDRKTGGIRAKVEWTAAGRAALAGREYRRFSPQWLIDPETSAPLGVNENLGGLVNRAAFQAIHPVVAKNGQNHKPAMTEKETADLSALITGHLAPITTRLSALEAKAASIETATTASAASASAITGLTARLDAIESAGVNRTKTEAKGIVAKACAAGRISPQDTKAIAFWEGAIEKDPTAAEQLDRLPVNPAFLRVTAGGAGNGGAPAPDTDTAEGFAAVVRAGYADGKTPRSQALAKAMAAHPKGYAAWRQANGKPGL
ncbi:MAG: phage protease [Verrucomicrobiota bacterium]